MLLLRLAFPCTGPLLASFTSPCLLHPVMAFLAAPDKQSSLAHAHLSAATQSRRNTRHSCAHIVTLTRTQLNKGTHDVRMSTLPCSRISHAAGGCGLAPCQRVHPDWCHATSGAART